MEGEKLPRLFLHQGYLLHLVGENLPCPHMWEEKVYFIKGFGLVTPDPFSLCELGGAGYSPPYHMGGAGNEARGEGYFPMTANKSSIHRQEFFSSSMYVYSVYTEPTLVVR